jgi:hypothetical protein
MADATNTEIPASSTASAQAAKPNQYEGRSAALGAEDTANYVIVDSAQQQPDSSGRTWMQWFRSWFY